MRQTKLHTIFALVAILALVFVVSSCKSKVKRAVVNQPAPNIDVSDYTGKPWKLSAEKGKVVVINFWASWCPPCKEELPSLNKLYNLTKNNPKIKIITILYKDDPTAAMNYLKAEKLDLPMMVDTDGSAAETFGLTGVPETFIIDKKGILAEKLVGGADFASPNAIDFITKLSEEK